MLTLLFALACTDKATHDSSEHHHGDSDPVQNQDSDEPKDSDEPQDSDEPEVEPGEALYMEHCAFCHGEDGSGTNNGPPVTNEFHHSDEELVRFMLEGKKQMEPVEDLTEEEAYLIAAWMRAQWG
ncbi:MAG: cytochrome c [Proteobacteria bacterium]|nr:cytochrome c [Pseudomonadota bacterium]MCP4920440.1 cytochrome c [Pseudomonadota bacterium]